MARQKKIKSKRKSKPRIRIKKNHSPAFWQVMFKLLPLFIILLTIGLFVKGAMYLLIDSDYFVVNTIKSSTSDTANRLRSLPARLDSKKGINIFSIDLKACESDILDRYPELKYAKVRRALPDTLEVSYAIRKPFLQVRSSSYYLVSDDAVILPGSQRTREPGLTIVTGIEISKNKLSSDPDAYAAKLKRAISLVKDIDSRGFAKRYGEIASINIYDLQNPVINMDNGTKIEIGQQSFKKKAAALEEVLNELKSRGKSAKVVDLRFEDIVVIPK